MLMSKLAAVLSLLFVGLSGTVLAGFFDLPALAPA